MGGCIAIAPQVANECKHPYARSVKYATALEYFKTPKAMARHFKVSTQAIYKWAKAGVIPEFRALKAERDTNGALKLDPSVYP